MTITRNQIGRSRGGVVRPRGFTLIELILVMALMVIVIGIGAPTLSGFFHGRKLDSEARRLLSLIRYGQSRAVNEGIPMSLWVDANQGTYGLQAQEGYLDNDTKAVQYTVDQELKITVGAPPPVANPHNFISKSKSRIPAILCQTDGTFGDSSPEKFTLLQGDHGSVEIALGRSGINYEILTNNVQSTR